MSKFVRSSVPVVLSLFAVAACGGGSKKPAAKPKAKVVSKKPSKAKTEEDYAADRSKAARALVAEGSTCLPDGSFAYQLAQNGDELMLCAVDTDESRALGPVACWALDKGTGALTYKAPAPVPGRGFAAKIEGGCVRGFCPPEKLTGDAPAHIAWSTDGGKVAVLSGSALHVFDAAAKSHTSTINVADASLADKAVVGKPTDLLFVGDTLFVAAADPAPMTNVWVFKADGTANGVITSPNPKEKAPISIHGGSLALLDNERVGLSEGGLSSLITYEAATGKRTKLTRKLPKLACKPAEVAAYWAQDAAKVSEKCKASLEPAVAHFLGADLIAGKKAMLVALRGSRQNMLAVLDLKNLSEKTTITLRGCSSNDTEEKDPKGGAAE